MTALSSALRIIEPIALTLGDVLFGCLEGSAVRVGRLMPPKIKNKKYPTGDITVNNAERILSSKIYVPVAIRFTDEYVTRNKADIQFGLWAKIATSKPSGETIPRHVTLRFNISEDFKEHLQANQYLLTQPIRFNTVFTPAHHRVDTIIMETSMMKQELQFKQVDVQPLPPARAYENLFIGRDAHPDLHIS